MKKKKSVKKTVVIAIVIVLILLTTVFLYYNSSITGNTALTGRSFITGNAVATSTTPCIDSDSKANGLGTAGFGFYNKGNVSFYNSTTGTTTLYEDSCVGANILEGGCSYSGVLFDYSYPCPAGCSNGKCTGQPTPTCVDSDGKNYSKYSSVTVSLDGLPSSNLNDFCNSGKLIELFCNGAVVDFEEHDCGTGKVCNSGKCIQSLSGSLPFGAYNVTNSTNTTATNYTIQCISGQFKCSGSSYVLCINSQWQTPLQIPGQCGYMEGAPPDPSVECIVDDDCNSEELCANGTCILNEGPGLFYIAIIIIVILILGILGVIIYFVVKKENKKLNKQLKKAAPKQPPKKLPKKLPKKPFRGNPQGQLKDVQRYIPPKR